MILYLHGFRSSPQSFKARVMGQRMHELGLQHDYACPQLPASPAGAIALAESLIEGSEGCKGRDLARLTVVGSSLGGFYATWLAEKYGCRAVLLNPAVKPPRELESYIGVTTQYHSDEPFEFKPGYVDELRALMTPHITRPERYYLVCATGDEVLDWREMVAYYQGARQTVIEGSDHGLADFTDHLDAVLAFCGVAAVGGKAVA